MRLVGSRPPSADQCLSVLIVLHCVTRKNPQGVRELSTKVLFPARDGAPERIEHTDIQLSAPLHLPFARFKLGFWELVIVCIHVSIVSTFSCIITILPSQYKLGQEAAEPEIDYGLSLASNRLVSLYSRTY
jgi:hypothetical protein